MFDGNLTTVAYAPPRAFYGQPLTAPNVAAPLTTTADDTDARLRWLVAFHAADDARRRMFRSAREEQEMLLMRRPVSTRHAYRLLGTLLGTLPPAAIFFHYLYSLGVPFANPQQRGWHLFSYCLCLVMNLICCLTGRWMGATAGKLLERAERGSWHRTILTMLAVGLLWGIVTGAAGGFLCFGIGALFGAVCAVPVGVSAFALFTPFHRLLARGGMIDARHLRPLAWGVTMLMTALILGLD